MQFRSDPIMVVQIMLICSLTNQSLSVWLLRRHIEWRAMLPFLLPGAAGVLFGVFALLHLQVDTYVRLLGGFLVVTGPICWSANQSACGMLAPWATLFQASLAAFSAGWPRSRGHRFPSGAR